LVQVTREAVDPLIPRAISKGISIELSDNDSTVNAYADPRAVVQIVTNIVNNAIAYTPSGGKIKVCVSCCPRAGKIAVLDTGIGIAENDRELVFSEFHRSEKARKLNANGSGLGLSIVKRLVDEMKGKVWVESNGENEGSAFFILLPTVLAKGDGRKDKNAVTDL
jgi:signal transduction histidine kinase